LPAASKILFLSSPGQATGNAVAVASPVPVAEVVAGPVCEDEVVVADKVGLVVVVVVVKGAIV
jgi:hypothetical protein